MRLRVNVRDHTLNNGVRWWVERDAQNPAYEIGRHGRWGGGASIGKAHECAENPDEPFRGGVCVRSEEKG